MTPEAASRDLIVEQQRALKAAFHVLVSCLHESGTLLNGEFVDALAAYTQAAKDKSPAAFIAELEDIRQGVREAP